MRIIKAILAMALITTVYARAGLTGPGVEIDTVYKQIDSVFATEVGLRDSVTKFYKANKTEIDIQYTAVIEKVLMKQYRDRFPNQIAKDATKEDIAENSMGTWFPNLMRLQDDMEPCVIKAIFVDNMTKKMNWMTIMPLFTFLKCTNDVSSSYNYEYK